MAETPLERILRVMTYPVKFEDNGTERCLTIDQAGALMRRIHYAIERAKVELAAGHGNGNTGTEDT